MAKTAFTIAPLSDGLVTNVKPWLISDDAYARLQNAYLYRGRIRKRFGARLFETAETNQQVGSRLRIALSGGAGVGITDGAGAATGTVPGAIFKIGQMFSIGNELFTVYQNGALYHTGAGTGTYNTATGVYTFVGAPPATQIYFYPSESVMGFIDYEQSAINYEKLIAFDTQFAYHRVGTGWDRLGTGIWTGTDSQFFGGCNYRGITAYDRYLFVTNFNQPDRIKYLSGTTWTTFNPILNSAGNRYLETARILISFKNRLIALNTIERSAGPVYEYYPNRARFCQNGDPIQTGAGVYSWADDIPGKGGWINAPTKEAIIAAKILKDRLIVYFERSTWEIVYTGNKLLPFVWQSIDSELGAESTFSSVLFDKVVLGVGNIGIHSCDGLRVQRIDQKIPDTVKSIHNGNDGIYRVHGIRDYSTELVYWTYPSVNSNKTFPDRVLVYNYRTSTWSFNDDSITAFGYYQNATDVLWSSTTVKWDSSIPWVSGRTQAKFRNIVAGNQQGFTFLVDPDNPKNSQSLQITNIAIATDTITITAISHNLLLGHHVLIEGAQGITGLNNEIYAVDAIVDDDNFNVIKVGVAGTYTGAGTLTRVSRIDILSKQYNFFEKENREFEVSQLNFQVDRTDTGEITVEFYTSSSNQDLLGDGFTSGASLGNNVLECFPYETFENYQARIYRPVYLQADGESVQFRLRYSDDQMKTKTISLVDFQLHSIAFYAKPSGVRL